MRLTQLLLENQKEDRANFIKKQLGDKLSQIVSGDLDGLLDKIAQTDPSPNGALMPWIARLIAKNPEQNKIEDLPRLANDLALFQQHKKSIENKDINGYKSFDAVYDAIEPFTKKKKLSPEERKAARQADKIAKWKSEIETVYNGPEGWIRIPHTKGAAQFLGQGTRWCTSAKCQNMYDHYNERDKLFVVFDKKSKERFQLHIESGSYADSADKMKGIDALPDWARPSVVDWYKKNKPDLSFKHVMTLGKLGGDVKDIAGEHNDLLDLMAQYGV
jgi:hypothetical protein